MDIVKKQEADILEARTAERLQKSKTQKSKLLSNIDNLLDTEKPETKQLEDDYLDYEEEFTPYIPTIFDILDRPRILPDPVDLTLEHLKEIENKLGLIRLCWPKLDKDVIFEERTNFPKSYLENNSKDRCLLLYAENFRRQYCFKYPHRKPLLLACDNECGMQKMVCTTIRPTKLPYHEVKTWQKCAEFISNLLKYEPLEKPTNLPNHLFSPHTTVLRQKGHCFELATTLCSLLIGLGYDAYVVSGYANKDITMQILIRVDSPYPEESEEIETEKVIHPLEKYQLKPIKDLRSQFLLMMEQREIDKKIAEKKKQDQLEQQRILETEKLPFDELGSNRIHSWILLLAGEHDVEKTIFIEPTTGHAHDLDSPVYLGIESVWNHLNYWVNMQDPKISLKDLNYDLTNINHWEHLLIGEPCKNRKYAVREAMEEENLREMYDEKHLDMPIMSWSMRINIPHEVLARSYPDGSKKTFYKRTFVEEFAPYVQEDGLSVRLIRYSDFECTNITSIEEQYKNRKDKLRKRVKDVKTNMNTEYFLPGREDCIKKHIYFEKHSDLQSTRTLIYYNKARYDGLSKIEIENQFAAMKIHFINREDRLYYENVKYTSQIPIDGLNKRRELNYVEQKFNRNEEKPASHDIAVREFKIEEREIHLKYHYDKGKITASTRYFIKPPLGEAITFNPELTGGYQSEIRGKPPRPSELYLLLLEQLADEEKTIHNIRDLEKEIMSFITLRDKELAFPELDVSIFDREQNTEYKLGMLEREKELKMHKEKEVEKETDFLAPYIIRLGKIEKLTFNQALVARNECIADFKEMLLNRANEIYHKFEKANEMLQNKQDLFKSVRASLKPEDETAFFEEVNDINFYIHTLEIRLARQRDLSSYRYEALINYLDHHPLLHVLNFKLES